MAEIDPTVALRVNSSTASGDPLGTAGAIVGLQGGINQNVLFAKTMAARQKLGSIIAGAPSMEAGLAAAQSDPDVAAFVPDLLSTNEGIESTLVGREAQEQTMAQSGLKSILGTEGSALSNPGLWQDNANAAMAMVPPSVRPQVGQAFDLLGKGLMDGLSPADPRSDLKKRMAALMVGSGTTDPGTAADILGTVLPSVQTLPVGKGGAPVTGVVSQGPLGGSGPVTMQPGQVAGGGSTSMASSPQTGNVVDQDFAALGIPPRSTPPAEPQSLQGPSQAQAAANAATGSTAGAFEDNINDMAQSLPNAMHRIKVTYNTLGQFLSGGGADTMANFAQGLQALKDRVPGLDGQIPQSAIDKIAGGNLGDAQLFKETIIPTLHSVLTSGSGNGKQTADEINSYLDTIGPNSDPRAILGMLNALNFQLQSNAYTVRGWNNFKQAQAKGDPSVKGVDDDKFPSWFFSTHFNPDGSPTDPSQFESLDPAGVQGIQPGAPAAGGPASANPPPANLKSKKDYLDHFLGGGQ